MPGLGGVIGYNVRMDRFPTVEARDLEGRRYRLPDDLPPGRHLLIVAFQRRHQSIVDRWKAAAEELADSYPDLTVWEMPALARGYAPARPYIDGGMRAAIPELSERQHVITAYTDLRTLTRLLGIPDRRNVHAFLVGAHGRVVWRESGNVDAAKVRLLAEALAEAEE